MRRSSPEMSPHRDELEKIVTTILDLGSDAMDLRDATISLHSLCSTIVGLEADPDGSEVNRETVFAEGRALSPQDAAICILDLARTSAFMRGVHDAVKTLQRRFPGERINLLYAGCGPFAPLVLPLATRFSPEQLSLTLLDAHQYSVDSVRRLGETFGISASFSTVRCCDAMNHTQPDAEPLHLVVIETMQKALENEPQVALTKRLAPQLLQGGILIPEKIRLAACLADMGREFSFLDPDRPDDGIGVTQQRRRVDLGTLLELTADGLSVGGTHNRDTEAPLTTHIVIPDAAHDVPDLMVRTIVSVFGDNILDDYDAGISYPTLIDHLDRIHPGDRLEFGYEEGPSPGLRVRRISTP